KHRRLRAALLAWLVLACAATNVIFLGGKRRAFGVFVAQLHVEFNQTRDSYAAVGYMTTTLSSTVILMSGRRFRIFQFAGSAFVLLACISSAYVPNPHWLFLSHTVFHGIGSSFILSVVGLIVNEYFDKQHNIPHPGYHSRFLGAIYFVVNMSGVIFFAKRPGLGDYVSNKSCVTAVAQRAPLLGALWFIDRIMTERGDATACCLKPADYVRRRRGDSLTKASYLTLLFASGEASTYLLARPHNGLHPRPWILIGACTAVMASLLVVWELFAADPDAQQLSGLLDRLHHGAKHHVPVPGWRGELTSLPALIAERNNYRWFFLIQAFMMYIKLAALIINVVLQRCCGVEQSPKLTATAPSSWTAKREEEGR
uniref:MFS domain-containing protein n=1 Tax=Macrostomum lignano TaxID=282301 RepID=A0A1I8FFQ5_9PLAT